jgi:peptide/nickel transport system substrate-binding protein
MLGRRRFLRVGTSAAAVSLLVACAGGQPSTSGAPTSTLAATVSTPEPSAPKTGGTFVVAHDSDLLLGGDTFRSTLTETTAVTTALNGEGNLVRFDRQDLYKIAPGLAESWESNPDFTQWTFKVRDNVKWHDGTPFTAQDAKWWLDLAVNGVKSGDKTRPPANSAAGWGVVSSAALDGNRLQVNLKAPSASFLTLLGDSVNQIAHPRHLMQPLIDQGKLDVAPQDVNYVSVGPFKMANYQKGSRIQLRRNDQYWEKDDQGRSMPYLDGIDFPILTDPSAQDYAFLNNQLDMGCRGSAHLLTSDRRDQYLQQLGDKVQFTDIGFTNTLVVFNTLKGGPFTDLRVRKAVSLWLDKAAYTPVAGGITFLQTILNPHNPYTSPDFMTWPGFNPDTREQDRAQARQLMADAGYANGFDTTLIERDTTQATGVFVQGQLTGLGINAKINLVDNAGWMQAGYARNYDLYDGSTPNALIPEQTQASFDVASRTPSGGNSASHEDPKVSDFYDQLHQASNMDQRVQVWRALEKYLILDQVYFVGLPARTRVIPYRSYVKGLFPPPENQYHNLDFASVWLDK